MAGEHSETFKRLAGYLKMEAKTKKGLEDPGEVEGITTRVRFRCPFRMITKLGPQVPQQPNSWDCGIYLLHYAQTFVEDAKQFVNIILVWRTLPPFAGLMLCSQNHQNIELQRRENPCGTSTKMLQ